MSKMIWRIREIARNAFKRYAHVNMYKRTPNIMGVQTLNVFRSRPQNFGVITMLALFWPLSKEKKTEESDISSADKKIIEEGLKEADQLYDNGQYNDCYDFLSKLYKKYSNNVEILWRKARAIYQLASQPVIDDKYKTALAHNAFSTITKAMEVDENNFAVHKWMAVILDLKCSCESTKERVKHLEVVKKHMLRAIELNPNDATTLYMLGEWCYRIADMPWYQRKIASALFATPPSSTFDEAIEYFSRAEVVEPRFYSMNLLMLGKTYLKLGKEDIGKYYLNLALLYPARSNDDHQANKEAQDILKRFK